MHTDQLPLFSWAVGEQLLHATLVEARDVRACAVQSPLEFVSFKQKLVPLGEKVLVLLAEMVAILSLIHI